MTSSFSSVTHPEPTDVTGRYLGQIDESAMLIESGSMGRAIAYMAMSVALSLAATFVGFAIARAVLAPR